MKNFRMIAFFSLITFFVPSVFAQEEETEQKQQTEPAFSSTGKFDFIPGEQVIFFDDFATDNIGDFPAAWNTNGSGEVVSVTGMTGKWFKMKPGGSFYPEMGKALPENFTVEFDLIYAYVQGSGCFQIDLYNTLPDERMDALVPGKGGAAFRFAEYSLSVFNWAEGNYGSISNSEDNIYLQTHKNRKIRISMTVQKQRVRLYMDENKIFDIPRLLPPGLVIDRLRFGGCEEEGFFPYICNYRVAAGAPDMRNKLLTEGRLVTHGITFDSGSDKIKPESIGTIKEIAKILQENAGLRVKITGHTDSDGGDALNMTLSKKRADAVKNALVTQFALEASRFETDGKGATQPVSPNTDAIGKANNRRVEFVKL